MWASAGIGVGIGPADVGLTQNWYWDLPRRCGHQSSVGLGPAPPMWASVDTGVLNSSVGVGIHQYGICIADVGNSRVWGYVPPMGVQVPIWDAESGPMWDTTCGGRGKCPDAWHQRVSGRELSLWEDPGVLERCNAWESVPLIPTEYAVVYSWVVWRGVCPPPSLPFGGGQFDLRRRTMSDGVRDSAVGQASTVTPWTVVNNNNNNNNNNLNF